MQWTHSFPVIVQDACETLAPWLMEPPDALVYQPVSIRTNAFSLLRYTQTHRNSAVPFWHECCFEKLFRFCCCCDVNQFIYQQRGASLKLQHAACCRDNHQSRWHRSAVVPSLLSMNAATSWVHGSKFADGNEFVRGGLLTTTIVYDHGLASAISHTKRSTSSSTVQHSAAQHPTAAMQSGPLPKPPHDDGHTARVML